MEGFAAIFGMLILTCLSVVGFVWGITRRMNDQRSDSKKESAKAWRAATVLRRRLHGSELLRSLRGGRKG